MVSRIYTAAIHGIEALPVSIETVMQRGCGFVIVGLPDAAVRESYQRIISALRESGLQPPRKSVIVNLAPADIKKEGAAFDLPIALSLLLADEQILCPDPEAYMLTGELGLDGSVLPVAGVLPMAVKAREMGFKRLIVPYDNVTEAAVVNRIEVYGVRHLNGDPALIGQFADIKIVDCSTWAVFGEIV